MPLIQQLAAVAHAVAAHLALDATRVEFAAAADAQSLTDRVPSIKVAMEQNCFGYFVI